jgi:hypothetical protein
MLAELFMLRLEATARSEALQSASERFIPIAVIPALLANPPKPASRPTAPEPRH